MKVIDKYEALIFVAQLLPTSTQKIQIHLASTFIFERYGRQLKGCPPDLRTHLLDCNRCQDPCKQRIVDLVRFEWIVAAAFGSIYGFSEDCAGLEF